MKSSPFEIAANLDRIVRLNSQTHATNQNIPVPQDRQIRSRPRDQKACDRTHDVGRQRGSFEHFRCRVDAPPRPAPLAIPLLILSLLFSSLLFLLLPFSMSLLLLVLFFPLLLPQLLAPPSHISPQPQLILISSLFSSLTPLAQPFIRLFSSLTSA